MKLCECGCGNPAPVAKRNHKTWGWIKGQPMRFLRGHGNIGGKPFLDGPEYLVDPKTNCWVWQRYKDSKGYGIIKRFGKNHKAHRFFYEQHKRKILVGFQLDHLCRNTSCVNPEHLEVVTNAENTRRKAEFRRKKIEPTNHSKRIHRFGLEENGSMPSTHLSYSYQKTQEDA